MGRKTNPTILRISSVLRSWDAKWFADRRIDYRGKLWQDLMIRRYLQRSLRSAAISRIEISRQPRETVLTIHTSRPAVVIGRGGSGIEKMQRDLKKLLSSPGSGRERIKINVQEIRNPDTDPAAVAAQVVDQLERRMPYRRILKQSVQRSMQAGALGVRVAVAGRLNGAEIARTEWLSEGNVPLHTFRADVAYAQRTAYTTYGTIGVKVWINRGDLLPEEEERPVKERQEKQAARRRRGSLADKAAKQKTPAAVTRN